jgi:hypothetical protein
MPLTWNSWRQTTRSAEMTLNEQLAFVVQLDLRLAGGMSFWDAPDAMATWRIAPADLCGPTDELPKSPSPLWWFSPETPSSLLSDFGFSPCDSTKRYRSATTLLLPEEY